MGTSSILAESKSRVSLPPPFIAIIPVGDRSPADLFVLVFKASHSGEIPQVRSLQGLVKSQTELARQMAY